MYVSLKPTYSFPSRLLNVRRKWDKFGTKGSQTLLEKEFLYSVNTNTKTRRVFKKDLATDIHWHDSMIIRHAFGQIWNEKTSQCCH